MQYVKHVDHQRAMICTTSRKTYGISMRLSGPDAAMIDRAAKLRGQSRTEFVRNAARRAAEEAAMMERGIYISTERFAEFCLTLSAQVAPVQEMVELARRPAPWEQGYSPKEQV